MNVAPHPPRPLPRPLPLRPPSESAAPFRSLLSSNPARCPLCLSGKSLSRLHGSQVTSHQSRLANSFRFRSCANRALLHYFGANKSFRIRSYRHPSCNPFIIRSYENPGGWHPLPPFSPDSSDCQLSAVDCRLPFPLTTFRINTCISVASKGLYLPLESTLMKKGGRGRYPPVTNPSTATRFRRASLAP